VPDTSFLCVIAIFLLRDNCSSAESCIHWWSGDFVAYLWWYNGQAYSRPWPLMASGLEILFHLAF